MRRLLTPAATVSRMDVAVAVGFVVLALVALLAQPISSSEGVTRGGDAGGIVLTLLMTVPVVLRRVFPLPVLGVAGVAAVIASVSGYGITVGALGVWVLVGSTALHVDRRAGMVLCVLGAVAVSVCVWVFAPENRAAITWFYTAAVGGLPPLVGNALRRQRELTHEILRLREAELDSATREERVRIARDIHDTVGHHLGAISLQARAGELEAGDGDAAAALGSLAAIARLSDRALEDTRMVLGVLRDDDGAGLRPTPRLSDLSELAETVAISGVDVTLEVDGAADDLPDPISTCAYRIIQEALTNTARHAAPARARVVVERAAGRVRLTVVDSGPGASRTESLSVGSSDSVLGAGQGLAGMRERAHAVGGTFAAAALPAGGWRVQANLPDRL